MTWIFSSSRLIKNKLEITLIKINRCVSVRVALSLESIFCQNKVLIYKNAFLKNIRKILFSEGIKFIPDLVKKMKVGQVFISAIFAESFREPLEIFEEPLKCHTCWATSLELCQQNGEIRECNRNQESCMLTERRQDGKVISVKFQKIF